MSRRLPKSTTDETVKDCWQTPHQLFNALNKIFNFSLDAAASDDHHLCDNYFTAEDSALTQSWSERLKAIGASSRNVWCGFGRLLGSVLGHFGQCFWFWF